METPNFNSFLKTETIKNPEGNEFSYGTEYGGNIYSLKLHGQEILYLDKAAVKDKTLSVRGGIPILYDRCLTHFFFSLLTMEKPHSFWMK